MKVEDVFTAGEKTIFVGELVSSATYIKNLRCRILIDGIDRGFVDIAGEVLVRGGQRDLWTSSPTPISRDTVREHDVWLIAS